MATGAVWRRIPTSTTPPPDGSPPGTPATYHPRQSYPRPIRSASDNPATRGIHTEAPEKRKDFLTARTLLKTELLKVIGDEIAETMAADQNDGSITGMSCVGCLVWLEQRYGTRSSAHVKKLVSALQTRCDHPTDFPIHCVRFNRAIRRL